MVNNKLLHLCTRMRETVDREQNAAAPRHIVTVRRAYIIHRHHTWSYFQNMIHIFHSFRGHDAPYHIMYRRGGRPKMENSVRRKALEGAEKETLDLIADVLTSQQWAELLEAPLERAVYNGNIGLARALVKAGAEFGEALHMAITGGHEEIAKDMLENGASVDAEDLDRDTPLLVAAQEGHTEIVRLLLLKGADVDGGGRTCEETPLCRALREYNGATALALVAAGADVNAADRFGTMPLHFAAMDGQLEMLRALIEHGADVNATDASGKTPMHFAVADAGEQGAPEMVDSLLRGGADETTLGDEFEVTADMPQNMQRVQALLANAQADRAWRRRGYLVMCRTHSDRVHQILPESIVHWARVIVKVLGLHDECIFQTIVEYL